MIQVSDDQFQAFVDEAVRAIPPRFARALDNIAFMIDDEPSRDQLKAGSVLHAHETLLGLYQGIPLPARSEGYTMVVPDVITIFKLPHEMTAHTLQELHDHVCETVWHEVAHYFGLDHGQIDALNY